jgi:hypothetical protein
MKPPEKVPELGYYYHYKHEANGAVNNYAYEVMGVGAHTEKDSVFFVVYRPLYESSVYLAGKLFDIRPLEMWMENVTKDGKTFPRFSKIADQSVIYQLENIKQKMYG